jgi:hypothetical protein
VEVKTAQGLLGHSDSRLTLDHYAQVVTELSEAAAAAMGARFFKRPRAMDARWKPVRGSTAMMPRRGERACSPSSHSPGESPQALAHDMGFPLGDLAQAEVAVLGVLGVGRVRPAWPRSPDPRG